MKKHFLPKLDIKIKIKLSSLCINCKNFWNPFIENYKKSLFLRKEQPPHHIHLVVGKSIRGSCQRKSIGLVSNVELRSKEN